MQLHEFVAHVKPDAPSDEWGDASQAAYNLCELYSHCGVTTKLGLTVDSPLAEMLPAVYSVNEMLRRQINQRAQASVRSGRKGGCSGLDASNAIVIEKGEQSFAVMVENILKQKPKATIRDFRF